MVETDPDSDGGHRTSGFEGEPVVATSVADGGVPDLDEFLRILSHRRRRCVLYCLLADDHRDVTTLARRVAAQLEATTPADVVEARYEQVRVALVHVDIPMLSDAGVVSYDRRSGDLRLDSPPTAVERLLESCAALEDRADGDGGGVDRTDRTPSWER